MIISHTKVNAGWSSFTLVYILLWNQNMTALVSILDNNIIVLKDKLYTQDINQEYIVLLHKLIGRNVSTCSVTYM